MAKFNEPEVFLIRKWSDVRSLENAAMLVRNKYVQIFEEVLQEVRKKHPELNLPWTKALLKYNNVGLGKTSWCFKDGAAPSGFWIDYVGLENLTAQDQEPPSMYVWINKPKIDLQDAENRLRSYARKALSREELDRVEFFQDRSSAQMCLPLPESRDCLLDLLLKDNARGFIRCMVGHFERTTKFSPLVDEIHSGGKKLRK